MKTINKLRALLNHEFCSMVGEKILNDTQTTKTIGWEDIQRMVVMYLNEKENGLYGQFFYEQKANNLDDLMYDSYEKFYNNNELGCGWCWGDDDYYMLVDYGTEKLAKIIQEQGISVTIK